MKQQEIQLNTVNTLEQNGSTYKGIYFTACGNTWFAAQVTGKRNYVSIHKITNNPFGLMGKEFANWDNVQEKYKQPEMKAALLIAETKLSA